MERNMLKSSTELSNRNNPIPNGCNFFVARKKRFCRLLARDGEKYCAEHALPISHTESGIESIDSAPLRVVCPLDNKHTCYAHKLKKHLKICNARPNQPQPYLSKGINSGNTKDYVNTDFARYLNDKSISDILKVITKINKVYEDYIADKVTELICRNGYVEEELKKPEYGPKTKKHLNQASSLVGIMEKYELLAPGACYVELGAGKGQLSYWVYKALERIEDTSVLLIERASHRHKFDNKLDKDNGRVHRIRADIADLILHKVEIVEKSKVVVGFAKHLCGDATDLAIRCLVSCNENNKQLLGLAMAFCCHHKCHWSPYVGKHFFETVSLTKTDFDIMCGMVSWATCGTGKGRDWTFDEDNHSHSEETINNRYEEAGLTRQDKEEIGRRCKRIIDWGRKMYLEEIGCRCSLHFYVKEEVSPENVCLIAQRVK